MNKETYKYNLKHYLRYILVQYKISLKMVFEYKVNFYAALIYEVIDNLIILGFGALFAASFGELFNWKFVDYVTLYFFANFIHITAGLFFYRKELEENIVNGSLNRFLCIPGNTCLNYILSIRYNAIINLLLNFLILFPYILYYGTWTFSSLVLSFLFSILFTYLFIVASFFFDSFSWIFLKLGYVLKNRYLREINDNTMYTYPGTLFQLTKIKYLLMLIPTYFIATIVVTIFNNKPLIELGSELLIALGLCILFTFGIYINWKYGLKRYEAFG